MNGDRGSNGQRRRWTVIAGVLATTAFVLGSVASAATSPITFSGQGTSGGDCSTKVPDASVSPGEKIWQFNLTGASDPGSALLTASFSDGTSVSGKAPDNTPGGGSVAMWFITTSATATVTSASATFSGEANNLVVSDCRVATTTTTGPGTPGTPGTPGGVEVGGESAVAGANAASAVEAAPSLTG